MPNIAQQDYIIIDWEGYRSNNAPESKLTEVKSTLKTIYEANPSTLLSVVMLNYDDLNILERVFSVGNFAVYFYSSSRAEIQEFDFGS